jgi:hypothetical protein
VPILGKSEAFSVYIMNYKKLHILFIDQDGEDGIHTNHAAKVSSILDGLSWCFLNFCFQMIFPFAV